MVHNLVAHYRFIRVVRLECLTLIMVVRSHIPIHPVPVHVEDVVEFQTGMD
jgi:hypothetical protein